MSAHPRLLLVSDRWPDPPDAGDRQRTSLMLDALQSFAEVDLLMQRHEEVAPEVVERVTSRCRVLFAPLTRRGQRGLWRLIRPLAANPVDRLAHNLGRTSVGYSPDPAIAPVFEAAHAERPYAAAICRHLVPLARAGTLGRIPTLLDSDDLDIEVYRTRLNATPPGSWQRWVLGQHLRGLRRIVPRMHARCAHIWIATPEDRPLVHHPSVSILPNIPFFQPESPAANGPISRTMLVVASWTHRVNYEGVDRFLAEIWPLIRRQAPDAALRLVGSGMTPEMRTRWSRGGVTPVGRVEDLGEEYARAAFCVAPLYEGGGSKIKVLEALAYRRTCVVTGHALRGYAHLLKPGESVLVADDPQGFAAACLALLGEPTRRAAMAECGHSIVRGHFSRAAFTRIVRDAVEHTLRSASQAQAVSASST